MPIKDNTRTIRIESVIGGHTQFANFSADDEFKGSYSIDPDFPSTDGQGDIDGLLPSGYLRPISYDKFSGEIVTDTPLWIVTQPKDNTRYVYGANGSSYSYDGNYSVSELANIAGSGGNGAEYYDNYIYFARNTSVARYGPLNGAPAMTTDYWDTTLGKTALTDTTYPKVGYSEAIELPNHVMKRGKDGALYFADVVGNQGVLHKIKTTKTTVEGDTDDGSTYNIVDFPYGMHPTAIEVFGDQMAVALYEGSTSFGVAATRQKRAKVAFWNTSNTSTYDLIFSEEFPDPLISALINANGVLYAISGNPGFSGVRISRYLGGHSFEQIAYLEAARLPSSGAIDAVGNRIVFGGSETILGAKGAVWAVGFMRSGISNAVFNIMGSNGNYDVTALKYANLGGGANRYIQPNLDAGFGYFLTGYSTNGLDRQYRGGSYSTAVWRSKEFKIGQPFKVKKIIIPMAGKAVVANVTITPRIYFDEGTSSKTLTVINNTNYPSKRNVTIRPDGLTTGKHSFALHFEWSGTVLQTIGLPITIEIELLDEE